MNPQDIDDKINEALRHDDYKWNKVQRIKYKSKGRILTNMNDMLVAVGQLFNNENLQKPSLLVKKTEKKARKAAAIGTLVSTIGISLIIHGYAKSEPEPIKQDPISQE